MGGRGGWQGLVHIYIYIYIYISDYIILHNITIYYIIFHYSMMFHDIFAWPGQDLKGSMSPLPSFGPQWFTAKLPGSLAPRPLPDCAFHLPPAPPGLIAQMPELATVPPGVAAMVAKALRAPPLTTPTMPPPPPSVLALPVRCGRASMVPPCCGG